MAVLSVKLPYVPAKLAVLGQQLFQPGIAQHAFGGGLAGFACTAVARLGGVEFVFGDDGKTFLHHRKTAVQRADAERLLEAARQRLDSAAERLPNALAANAAALAPAQRRDITGRIIDLVCPLGKGQRLTLKQPKQGVRAYLAAPGGFLGEDVLGSCATVVREALGGLDGLGTALAKGDGLSYAGVAPALRAVPEALRPDLHGNRLLDLVMGAQIGEFAGQSLFDAFNCDWTLDSRADRMGIRLLGPALQYQGAPMISEGIPLGAVQVPPDGQPIVLLNDRQTIGGYPRLGALTPLALAQLAQCMPGAVVRFQAVVQDTAWQAHRDYLKRWC